MVNKFRERFKLSCNTSLANYKFRKLVQKESESFDLFVIRVKKECSSCNFKCASAACTVANTMVRDQIIFGTTNDDIRRVALHEEWDLETLIKKGRSLEAATSGAQKIKSGSNTHSRREEGEYSRVNRTQPKKYSRKYNANKENKSARNKERTSCDSCNSSKCGGKKLCPGKNVTCFACNKRGHFKGAKICKQRNSARRLESKSESQSENDTYSEDSLAEEGSSTDESEEERKARRTTRRKRPIIARIKGVRKTSKSHKRKTLGKYEVTVAINGQRLQAYADTGADICIMSWENAKSLNLPLEKTSMKIRPYGSKAKKCKGVYTGTIMFGDAVTNANIYVIKKEVETLLSGRVCEQLGIIKFRQANVNLVEPDDPQKKALFEQFPSLFKGIGTLKGYKVKFHIDP